MKRVKIRRFIRNTGFNQRSELDLLKGRQRSEDGKQRVMVLTNDHARLLLVPGKKQTASDSKLLEQSNYERLLDIAARPTMEEKEDYVKKMKEDNDRRERELDKRIKQIGLEKMYKPKLSQLEEKVEEEKRMRDEHMKKRAAALKIEEEDVMKLLNSEILKAQCESVLKKQMEQKAMTAKFEKEIDRKQAQEMVDESESLFYKTKAKDEELRKESDRKMVEFLEKQLKVKEMKKALKKQEAEKEVTKRKLVMNEERRKELEKIQKVEIEKKKLMKLQRDSITEKLKMKLKDKEDEDDINRKAETFVSEKDERENITKEKLRKQWEKRSEAQEAVIKQKKEEDELRREAEEFERKRNENELDRKWRQKEKERIMEELKAKKQFHEDIDAQIQDKYDQKTKEILTNLEEIERIKDNLQKINAESEERDNKIKEDRKKFVTNIAQQTEDKAKEKERQRLENEIFLETMKEIEEQRKATLKKAIEDKIDNLRSFDSSNDNIIRKLKQKAELLKTKII